MDLLIMNNDKQMTIHFNNGTKMEVSFPTQIKNSMAAVLEAMKKGLESDKLISCQLGWKILVKSWDRFQIPLPFSRCEMTFGEPIRVPRDATEEERTQLREQLQTVLLAGTTATDN
jgi:lysophospholipid acyltransferase (LPLAT)-like uncharacterized protein